MPRYSVIAADTLRDIVTLTFDLLTLVSGHTWRVTWSILTPYNFYGATIKANGVMRQNSLWPCVKNQIALYACAKSRQP